MTSSSWPRFRLELTANEAVTAVATAVAWDEAPVDSHGGWVPALPTEYEVRRSGLWQFAWEASRTTPSTTTVTVLALAVNGVYRGEARSRSSAVSEPLSGSWAGYCDNGDIVTLVSQNLTALATSSLLDAGTLGPATLFWGLRSGPEQN